MHEVHEERAPDGSPRSRDAYDLIMRPRSEAGPIDGLHAAGFTEITIGPGVGRRTPDRRFVTAVRR